MHYVGVEMNVPTNVAIYIIGSVRTYTEAACRGFCLLRILPANQYILFCQAWFYGHLN